jgi:exonuclease VII small subunit
MSWDKAFDRGGVDLSPAILMAEMRDEYAQLERTVEKLERKIGDLEFAVEQQERLAEFWRAHFWTLADKMLGLK